MVVVSVGELAADEVCDHGELYRDGESYRCRACDELVEDCSFDLWVNT